MASLIVDFAEEKEAGYQRIFAKSPLLSSIAANWEGLYVAYDYFLPGQTPELCVRQHGIGIFVEMPTPAQADRCIDGELRREQVVQGDVVVVPANTWHRTAWDAAGGAIVLGFDPATFAQTVDETVERDRLELTPHFATPDPLVHHLGLALKQALAQSHAASRLYAETMTNAVMVHLLQHYSSQRVTLPVYEGGLSRPQLRRVLDYIESHLEQDLSLRELSALVQMSPHYFSQLFKQSIGVPPYQYVIRCRIERAKDLLKRQSFPIPEIARMVGFVDQSHFHRHFKRHVGITPKAFRQQIKL